MEKAKIAHTNNLVCFGLKVHIWTGRRRLEKTALIHANPAFAKLPEKDLANLGSVKIINPDEIKKFNQVKKKAESILKRAGLPIMGYIGVPTELHAATRKELLDCQQAFETLETDLLKNLDKKLQERKTQYLLTHPEWAELFRDLPTAKIVAGKFGFSFDELRIAPPSDDDETANESFHAKVGGLKGELLAEVSEEAEAYLESLMVEQNGATKERSYVTPKTLGPLKRAAVKVKSFAFLDASLAPMADLIQHLIDTLPSTGRIEGQHMISLKGMATMLRTQQGLATLMKMASNATSHEEALDEIDALAGAFGAAGAVTIVSEQLSGPWTTEAETTQSPSVEEYATGESNTTNDESSAIDLGMLVPSNDEHHAEAHAPEDELVGLF